jgi:hypothetical protein
MLATDNAVENVDSSLDDISANLYADLRKPLERGSIAFSLASLLTRISAMALP